MIGPNTQVFLHDHTIHEECNERCVEVPAYVEATPPEAEIPTIFDARPPSSTQEVLDAIAAQVERYRRQPPTNPGDHVQ